MQTNAKKGNRKKHFLRVVSFVDTWQRMKPHGARAMEVEGCC